MLHLQSKDYDVKASWLKEKEMLIKKGLMTITDAAKEVEVDTIWGTSMTISICPKKLTQIFKDNGVIFFLRGRKGHIKEHSEELVNSILTYYAELHCGTKKMWEFLNKNG